MLKLIKAYNINKRRYFFTLIGLILVGTLFSFSISYKTSIEDHISQDIPLEQNEYHLFYDENRFSSSSINYYGRLKDSFEKVIPMSYSEITIEYDSVYYGITAVGTLLNDLGKLYIRDTYIKYEVVETLEKTTDYQSILIMDILYQEADSKIIQYQGNTFEVIGTFRFLSEIYLLNEGVILFDLDDFYTHIKPDKIVVNSGIEKYIIDGYIVTSDLANNTVISIISNIYDSPSSFQFYVESYQTMYDARMNAAFIFDGFTIVLMVLVSLISVVNISTTLSFTIYERRHTNTIFMMLGLRISKLKGYLIIEMGLFGLVAGLLSIAIGLIISIVVTSLQSYLIFSVGDISKYLIVPLVTTIVPIIYTWIYMQFMSYKKFMLRNFE